MRHDEVLICISKANFIRYLLKSLPQVFQFYLTIDSDKWNRVFPQPSHKPIVIKGNLILSLSFYYFLKDRDYVRVDWVRNAEAESYPDEPLQSEQVGHALVPP